MKETNLTISVIRVIAMMMIIACHILQGLNSSWAFWVNLGVPIFFFMSGFLYGKKEIKDIKEFYQKRLWKILLPSSILVIIVLSLEFIIFHQRYSSLSVFATLLGFGGFYKVPQIVSHTWFVSYILLCYLCTPLFQYLFRNKDFQTNLITLIGVILLLQCFQEFNVLSIKVSWIVNYLIGYFYSKCAQEDEEKKTTELLIIIGAAFFTPFAIFFQEKIPVTLPRIVMEHSNSLIQYGHVMLGSLLFIVLYHGFNKRKIKGNKVLTFFDHYSYEIYLVHQVFILFSFSLLRITNFLFLNILLILICTLIGSIILKKIYQVFLKLRHE